MLSSSRFKGTFSQIIYAAYPIVCFPVLVRTFLRKGFVSMHTQWYCICVHYRHIENSLKKVWKHIGNILETTKEFIFSFPFLLIRFHFKRKTNSIHAIPVRDGTIKIWTTLTWCLFGKMKLFVMSTEYSLSSVLKCVFIIYQL